MKNLLLVLMLVVSVQVFAKDFNQKEVKQLNAVMLANIKAMNNENIVEYMKDIHPKSPGFVNTKKIIARMFKLYDLKATILDMKPLMIDDKYFIVRARQKTEKIGGKLPFNNNIVDAIHVYKKYKGKWLLWSSMILEVKMLKK